MAQSSKDAENNAVHEQHIAPIPDIKTGEAPTTIPAQSTESEVEIPSAQHGLNSEQDATTTQAAGTSNTGTSQEPGPAVQGPPAAHDAPEIPQDIEAEDVSSSQSLRG